MDHGGYSLVELMVVVVIMVILASVSIGVYNGYVKRAKSAVAYEKGHRIAEALEICETEYDLTGNISISRLSEISGKLMKSRMIRRAPCTHMWERTRMIVRILRYR